MLLFILLLIITFAVIFYLLRPTKTETAVQKRLEDLKVARSESTGQTILKEEGYSSNPETAQIVRQIPGAIGTLNLLRQSGQTWMVSSVMGVSLLLTVLTCWITSYFLPGIFLSIIAGILAGSIPYIYLLIMREQRFRKCDQLLPEAIDLMARGLRAGHALTAVLEVRGQQDRSPDHRQDQQHQESHAPCLPLGLGDRNPSRQTGGGWVSVR